jgi:hypothetical protein
MQNDLLELGENQEGEPFRTESAGINRHIVGDETALSGGEGTASRPSSLATALLDAQSFHRCIPANFFTASCPRQSRNDVLVAVPIEQIDAKPPKLRPLG